MPAVLALLCLLAPALAAPSSSGSKVRCSGEEVECSWGCCPWGMYCCPCGSCGLDPGDCPCSQDTPFLLESAKRVALVKVPEDETTTRYPPCPQPCPGGCCPYQGWYCCTDYCQPTAADCPYSVETAHLVEMGRLLQESAKKVELVKVPRDQSTTPDPCPTWCPGGCCPMEGWYCCADSVYCTATAEDCPLAAENAQLVKMAKDQQCDGTLCPDGCCPEVNWACCPDWAYHCPDCPFAAKTAMLVEMAKDLYCEGTMCPVGLCCPEVGWYCCPDNMYCAATAEDCPFAAKTAMLVEMAKDQQCEGTMCPAGCCMGGTDWYCCTDFPWCAMIAEDCPGSPQSTIQPPLAATTANLVEMGKDQQCEGTLCPSGCCPEVGWYCCPDNPLPGCAPTAADCT